MSQETHCPLCSCTPQTWKGLAKHLMAKHAPESDWTVYGRLAWSVTLDHIYCWCDAGFPNVESFAQHLKDHGGPAAHILECKLGV